MRKLILLSLVLLPLMGSLFGGGGPPPPMPGSQGAGIQEVIWRSWDGDIAVNISDDKYAKVKDADFLSWVGQSPRNNVIPKGTKIKLPNDTIVNHGTPVYTAWASAKFSKDFTTDAPARGTSGPKPQKKPAGPAVTGGMAIKKDDLKKLPIGTRITVKQNNIPKILEVFAVGGASPLPGNYYGKAGGLLRVTMIESGSDGFAILKNPMSEGMFVRWIKDKPEVNGVIGFASGQSSAGPKPSGPKPSGPKPSVPLSPEQKLAQNLASLEVNLKTLNKNI